MSDQSTTGTERCWDHEDCPRGDCGGELQQQDRINVMCLRCERVWAHYRHDGEHQLHTSDGRIDARKPAARADGGSFANAGACWICGAGDGSHDTDLTLDLGYDAYVHPECLDEHDCENIHEYETNRSVGTASERGEPDDA